MRSQVVAANESGNGESICVIICSSSVSSFNSPKASGDAVTGGILGKIKNFVKQSVFLDTAAS